MQLIKIGEAASLLGLSAYEIRTGIDEGRYPAYWTRNRRRVLVDPEVLTAHIRNEMEESRIKTQQDRQDDDL